MKRTLAKIIDYAVCVAEPERIILFGSMANGTANVFSDVDLLIISEKSEIKKDIAAMITSFSSELSLKTDVLLYSILEIQEQKDNSFISAILKQGDVVFEKEKSLHF